MMRNGRRHRRSWPAEFLGIAADSMADLVSRMSAVRRWLAAHDDAPLKHLARTLAAAPHHGSCRVSIVAGTAADACAKIDSALERIDGSRGDRLNDPRGIYRFAAAERWPVAFLFPGDGAQYRGMFSDLCCDFPEVRAWFDLIDRVAHDRAQLPSRIVYPLATDSNADDTTAELWRSVGGTELVFAACQGMRCLLEACGIRPDAVVGHCSGDLSALLAAGTVRVVDEVRLVDDIRAIERTLVGIHEGVVFATSSDDARTVRAIADRLGRDDVFPLLDNCPQQVVSWTAAETAESFFSELRAANVTASVLPFRRAVHTPHATEAAERLFAHFETAEFLPPRVPAYSCVTAQPYPDDGEEIRRLAASVWCRPVRFRETIEAMYAAGHRLFVEVGPRGNLTGFVRSILEGKRCLAIPTDVPSRPGLVQFQHVLAQLFAAGVPMQLDALYASRGAEIVDLEASPGSSVARSALLVSLNARLPRLRATEPASIAAVPPVAATIGSAPARDEPERAASVLDSYFKTMAQLIAVERDVIMAALEPPARSVASWRSDLPFVRDIVSLVPGQSAKVRCTLDADEDLFLRDHTIGPRRFDGRVPRGLPVVPMTVAVEMLAEAAALVVEGRRIAAVEDIEMSRWLALEQDRLVLELTARRREGDTVDVELREDGSGHVLPALRGAVVLGSASPRLAVADDFRLREPKLSVATDARAIYGDPRMFHGPLFQTIQCVEQSAIDGIVASLVNPSSNGFFRARRDDRLLIHPALLDGMGQVIGCWLFDHFESESVFPLRLRRLQWFQDVIPAGAAVSCRARIRTTEGPWLEADLELIDARGFRIAAIEGWKNRRVRFSQRLYDFMRDPDRAVLTMSLGGESEAASNGSADYAVALNDLPDELGDGGMIWLKMLAHTVLTRSERADWYQLEDADAKVKWLAERIAAKDATRLLARAIEQRELCPADISVRGDGATTYVAEWLGQQCESSIRIDHTPNGVIAIASSQRELICGRRCS